jgi:hypothetical protein
MITITIVPQTQAQIAAVTKLLQDYPASTEAQSQDQPSPPKTTPRVSSAKSSVASAPAAEPKLVTLETVRARLTDISQAGKKTEVSALIAEFGATKLTEVKSEDYAALMAKAEKL